MTSLARKIAFLHPKAGLSVEGFRRYWRESHGPLVATSPGYGRWRRRYAQNHVLSAGPIGAPFTGAGIAMFDLPSQSSNEEDYSASDIYQNRVRVDELNFIDMDRTISMTTATAQFVEGGGPTKVILLAAAREGVARKQIQQTVEEAAQDFLHTSTGKLARGLTVNHVVPGSFRLPGARPAAQQRIDCIYEAWFGDDDLSETVDDVSAWRRLLPAGLLDTVRSFWAEELVFFDGGSTSLASTEVER